MIDIVFPGRNEQGFVSTAQKLGYTGLVFVYDKKEELENAKLPRTNLEIKKALLAEPRKVHAYREKYFLIVKSSEQDQHVLEKTPPNIIFGLEALAEKDQLHQRTSGLNQVLCASAARNKVSIGFSFTDILTVQGFRRAQILGRVRQNIALCRKYKVKMVIASFAKNPTQMRNQQDLRSLFVLLGMHPKEAREALEW